MVYIAIDTRYLFVMDHAEIVWYRTLQLGKIHYHHLKYAPLLTGLLIACIQYLPEMTTATARKRPSGPCSSPTPARRGWCFPKTASA